MLTHSVTRSGLHARITDSLQRMHPLGRMRSQYGGGARPPPPPLSCCSCSWNLVRMSPTSLPRSSSALRTVSMGVFLPFVCTWEGKGVGQHCMGGQHARAQPLLLTHSAGTVLGLYWLLPCMLQGVSLLCNARYETSLPLTWLGYMKCHTSEPRPALTLTTIWYSSGWGMRYPANTTFLSRCSCLQAGGRWKVTREGDVQRRCYQRPKTRGQLATVHEALQQPAGLHLLHTRCSLVGTPAPNALCFMGHMAATRNSACWTRCTRENPTGSSHAHEVAHGMVLTLDDEAAGVSHLGIRLEGHPAVQQRRPQAGEAGSSCGKGGGSGATAKAARRANTGQQ